MAGKDIPRIGEATCGALALAAILSLVAPSPLAAQSDATCIAYMEADAAYGASVREADAAYERAITDKIANRPLSDEAAMILRLLGLPDALEAKDTQLAEAADERERAYREAYEGPTSEIGSVMRKVITADRKRCRRRFGQQ